MFVNSETVGMLEKKVGQSRLTCSEFTNVAIVVSFLGDVLVTNFEKLNYYLYHGTQVYVTSVR